MCAEGDELKRKLKCSRCGQEKLADEFAKTDRSAEERKCKTCQNLWREEDRQRAEEARRAA
eukprot:1772706-Pyramimonas_sp.AAC.1